MKDNKYNIKILIIKPVKRPDFIYLFICHSYTGTPSVPGYCSPWSPWIHTSYIHIYIDITIFKKIIVMFKTVNTG